MQSDYRLMPRYVILRHETPAGFERPTHWDLMLEREGVLVTWALAEAPAIGKTISAEKLADHRLPYLDYEGPVSQGRGTVTRWDAGEYLAEKTGPEDWIVRLIGGKLRGKVALGKVPASDTFWTASFTV
jgi:hypothetical protein